VNGGFRSFSRRQAAVAVIVAAAVGLVVRWVVETPVYAYGSDHFHHLLLAQSLAAGDGFQSGGSQHPDLSRPPLFPLLTAGLSWLTGDVDTAAQILVLLASALVVVPLYVLARNTFGARASLAVLPLGALSGLVATAGLMAEPLFLLLGLSAAAATWWAMRRSRTLAFFAAGALAGACALTRYEGLALLPVLSVWAGLGSGRPQARRAHRLVSAMLVLAGALVLYGPYVAWASARMGRWAPAPGVQYLQDMRSLTDRLRLREAEGPWVPWTERAQYIVAADHRRRVLDTYFLDGVILEPDPAMIGPVSPTGPSDSPPVWKNVAKRRINIFRMNLSRLPYYLYASGFLPVVPVILGMLGAIAALRLRRTRRVLVYLLSLAAASLAPVLSHVEARFLYLPFAFGLVASAAGWGWLVGRLSLLRGAGGRITRLAVHAGLVAVVASSGLHHHAGHRERFQRSSFRKELAPLVAQELPPGPILAVQMHVPYWSGRPYRPIPVGEIGIVLDYARSQEAVGIVLDSARDLQRRPHLAALFEQPPPPGLRLLHTRRLPEGGEVRLFALSPVPETAPVLPDADP